MSKTTVIGYLCGIASAVAYGLNPLFGLPLYARGMTTPEVLFFRFLLAIAMLSAIMLIRRRTFRLGRRQVWPLLAGGALLALSCLFLFLSFHVMDAGIAATILFVYPVMVALIMALGFRERLSRLTWGGMGLAMAGIAMLHGAGGKFSFAGLVCVLLSALTYAVYMILVRESPLRDLNSDTLTLYAMAVGIPLFLIPLHGGADLRLPPDLVGWICVGGLALFPALLSFLLMAVAVKRIGPTPTAIIGALEPCTALIVGATVFHEKLTFRAGIGIALILVAVTIVVLSRGRAAKS